MRKFRAGKWEHLWNESIKTADKIKAKKGRKPDQARKRTDREKDEYAQKCASQRSFVMRPSSELDEILGTLWSQVPTLSCLEVVVNAALRDSRI